jgi:MSHA pilin protein MshC
LAWYLQTMTTSTGMKTDNSIAGFTLIELTIVIVLFGILAIYVAPRMNFQNYEDTRASVELIQGIRYAQFQSLYRTATPGFQISITASGFSVNDPNGNVLPDPAETGNYVRNYNGVLITPTVTITFDGRGQPNCGAYNCTTANLPLTVAGNSITMERFTGFVH